MKIAYRNNETIKEDIRLVAFLNERIYGIARDNNFYLGEHRSEGNLTARALAVQSGEKTVVIVNVDVCGLTADFTGLVKNEIREKHNLPVSAVFINSSHTHFAPVSQNWLTWQEANQRPDSIFLYTIVRNGILNAIDKALNTMSPAELWFGRGTTDIGYNRSLKDHPELYDSDVDVLKIVYSGKNQESYLFMTACHPVFSTAGKLHYTISANYPGVARKLVEERTGTENSLFLQGTAGDINPRDNGEYISGEKLSNEVISVLNKPMSKIDGAVSFFLDTINIPVRPWTKEEILAFREKNADLTGDVYAEKNVKWADLMMDYYSKGTMPESLPVYINTINIGNWKLVGFSRETTTEYSFGVKKMWPGKLVSVAGYTNDVSSYLPTHMHLEAKNYEGLDSFFWYGQPNVFPMDADKIILEKIRSLAH
ncbi:MAG: neutral/alkaline non-lysosomal ceramidase N-terminal domain-containing protein [Bacteroidales bacterium]|nr:neutral/alkaline non-lysosomal ceramidase N-terminal domain-containing protein [Bacteroidales bacterium]